MIQAKSVLFGAVLIIANGAVIPSVSLAQASNPATKTDLTQKYGQAIADAIYSGVVLKDMTMEQVVLARGAPEKKEAIPPNAELWHFDAGEVAFDNGRVTYVSLEPLEPPESEPDEAYEDYDEDTQAEMRGDAEEAERHIASTSNAQSAAVQAPILNVGDSYVYESVDLSNPKSSFKTRRTVVSSGNTVVLSNLLLGSSSAKPRNLYFNNEWNLLRTLDDAGNGKDYSPPLKYYEFPLFTGKQWSQETVETTIKTGDVRYHKVFGVVGDWEIVTVPAGTFRGMRVTLNTALYDPKTGETKSGSDISWYVPEVKRSVKSLITTADGKQQVIQLISYEGVNR